MKEKKDTQNLNNMREGSRRQFLKNTSLSMLSLAAFPTILKSNSPEALLSKKGSLDTCVQSTEDAYGQGPFYTTNAPFIQNNQLADINDVGTRIIISGQVYNLDCSEWIPDTEIDIWHANDAGDYDIIGYNYVSR